MDYEKMINETLHSLVRMFNEYSELVALNAYKGHNDDIKEWNRGHEAAYEDEAKELADKLGRKINYELRESKYHAGEPNEYTIEFRAMYVTY